MTPLFCLVLFLIIFTLNPISVHASVLNVNRLVIDSVPGGSQSFDIVSGSSYQFDGSYNGSFNASESGNQSLSGSGTTTNNGGITSGLYFYDEGYSLSALTSDSTRSNYNIVALGTYLISPTRTIDLLTANPTSIVYLAYHKPTGAQFYIDGTSVTSNILTPISFSVGNSSTQNQTMSESGTYSGTSSGSESGSFKGTISTTNNSRYFSGRFIIYFDSVLEPGNYDIAIVAYYNTFDNTISSIQNFYTNLISSHKNIINNGSVVFSTNAIYINLNVSIVSRGSNLYIYFMGDVPESNKFTITNGSSTSFYSQYVALSSTSQILNDLESAGGANNSTNSAIENMGIQFDQYQQDTDTSLQYSYITDDLFEFDTSVWSQMASTITLFSSCVTLNWNALGDFSTALTVFLIVVLVISILGLARYMSTSGTTDRVSDSVTETHVTRLGPGHTRTTTHTESRTTRSK